MGDFPLPWYIQWYPSNQQDWSVGSGAGHGPFSSMICLLFSWDFSFRRYVSAYILPIYVSMCCSNFPIVLFFLGLACFIYNIIQPILCPLKSRCSQWENTVSLFGWAPIYIYIYINTHAHTQSHIYIYISTYVCIYPSMVSFIPPCWLVGSSIFDSPHHFWQTWQKRSLVKCMFIFIIYIYIYTHIYTHIYIYTHPAHIQPQKITKNLGQST